ncbi:MAG: YgfZ/GcvT domain-containing protein [Burkholderiaceae bacterium]
MDDPYNNRMKFTQSAPPRPPARNASQPVQNPATVWSGLINAASAHGLEFRPPSETSGPAFNPLPNGPDDWPAQAKGVICALTDHSVLKVSGDDAETFLQGQLTNDLAALAPGMAQRNGLCSPKGRLIADFLAIRLENDYLLILSSTLAEAVRKRLSMFVMRAKVEIQDATDQYLPLGCLGSEPAGEAPFSPAWPALLTVQHTAEGFCIGLEPVASAHNHWRRMLILMPAPTLTQQLSDWPDIWPLAPTAWWQTGEVLAGTPRIELPSTDAFVPQMINFELVGGVSFQKGCFPGQEVVARTQYLGKLKRRASIGWVASAEPIPVSSEVTGADDAVIGSVLVSGPGAPLGQPDRQWVLFETRLAALADANPAKINGQPVILTELPYEIPVAERFERPDL